MSEIVGNMKMVHHPGRLCTQIKKYLELCHKMLTNLNVIKYLTVKEKNKLEKLIQSEIHHTMSPPK